MKRAASYRITADICFFFAVLSIFHWMVPFQRPMALFAAASLGVSLAAVYCSAAPLRFLLALLPGLAFLTTEHRFLTVVPALAWLYLILMLTSGRFHIRPETYTRTFRIEFAVWIVLLVGCVLTDMIDGNERNVLPSLFFALAYLCCGVFAMRRSRMNADVDFRWNLANAAVVTGVPLAAVGCSAALYGVLRLLRPLAALISPVLARIIAWILGILFVPHPENLPEEGEEGNEYAMTNEESEVHELYENPQEDSGPIGGPDPAAVARAAKIAAWILIGLALAAAVLLIVRFVRKSRSKADTEEYLYEETVEAGSFRRHRSEDGTDVTNARRIRNVYRSYMELMRKRGIRIRKDTTSGEILTEAESRIVSPGELLTEEDLRRRSPDAERLRALYLKARYADGSVTTDADVEEAAACLQRIREDDSWKKAMAEAEAQRKADAFTKRIADTERYLFNDYMK